MFERYERCKKLAVFTAITNHVPCIKFLLAKPGNPCPGSSMRRCDYTYIGDGINYVKECRSISWVTIIDYV